MEKISVRNGEIEISIEGSARFVEKNLDKLSRMLGLFEKMGSLPEKSTKKESRTEMPSTNEAGKLKKLYNERKPSTHYDKIALFAHHLNECGKETFTTDDIAECYKIMREETRVPGNLNITLQDTIRHTGYIKRIGKGKFQITSAGTNHVLHELPTGVQE